TKIAAMTTSDAEVRALAAFTIAHADEGVIVIAMGEHGTRSRVFFPALGSLLTFATAPGAPVVSGQLSFDDTVAELARFYPSRA
ncbi:MAG: type I 3-dehydroquinate dehydratase, partial [Actinobacteria bacterium]|nr:type I 3-dehydroquinate dehydratase [Actinomycetota bacterium]